MHMKPNYGHISMICYHLQPMKPLYIVTGPLGTQPQRRSTEYQTIFKNKKFVFPELLWPYTMVSVAASGSTSFDPSLVSYALEQPEMLRSLEYWHKFHAPFKCAPTV